MLKGQSLKIILSMFNVLAKSRVEILALLTICTVGIHFTSVTIGQYLG